MLSIGLVVFCHLVCFSASRKQTLALAQRGVGWKDVLLQEVGVEVSKARLLVTQPQAELLAVAASAE